jgi:UDP-2-acetamido-3-amino-2,3-dideoxy-glucuronate N-acetyltransferase
VRNYHQLRALALICDRNEVLISKFKQDYPGVEVCCAYQ